MRATSGTAVLADSDLQTGRPHKGFASYRDIVIGDRRHPSPFWYYEHPFGEVSKLKGYVAPYNERAHVVIDQELQERPVAPVHRQAGSVTGTL